MTESLYDLLGVEPTATESEIKSAWRSLVTVLGPTDHRFASINEAASVLLDSDKRAEYDATLVEIAVETPPETPVEAVLVSDPVQDEPEQDEPELDEPVQDEPAPESEMEPVGSDEPSEDSLTSPEDSAATVDQAAQVPTRTSLVERLAAPAVVTVVAVLAVALIVATSIAYLLRDSGPKVAERSVTINLTDASLKPITQQVTTRESSDVTAALQAAIAAAPKALSYDYRTLAKDEAAAKSVMTAEYAAKSFTPYFDGLVKSNAPRLKQVVVCGSPLDAGVVRTAPNLVEVLLLIDRFATNASGAAVSQDFADITMVNQNGTWLISNFATAPISK